MLNLSHTHSQPMSSPIWGSRMLRNSSRIAPVSATLAINSTQTHQKNLSDTWSNTNTGHHSKWSQPVSKLPQPEILPDRSLDTEVFHSKSSVSDMLTLLKISRLFIEKLLQDPKNRQNSVELDLVDADQRELNNLWIEKQQEVIRKSRYVYEWAIANGIAKEQARAVLPEGLIESKLYMNGTLRSWVHFIELRSGNGTQKEHQLIALECAKVIAAIFPMSESLVQNV